LFIGVGFIAVVVRAVFPARRFWGIAKDAKLDRESIAMTSAFFALLLVTIILPVISIGMGITRLYHISLFYLAPLCIIGGETIFSVMAKGTKALVRRTRRLSGNAGLQSAVPLRIILAVIILLFLFNTGFIFELTGEENRGSLPLSLEYMKENTDEHAKATLYNVYFPEQDVVSARWLAENRNNTAAVYSDLAARWLTLPAYAVIAEAKELRRGAEIKEEALIYLRYLNVAEGVMVAKVPTGERPAHGPRLWTLPYPTTEIMPVLENSSKIYSNGGSEVYYVSPE